MKLKTYRVEGGIRLTKPEREFLETEQPVGRLYIVGTSIDKALGHAATVGRDFRRSDLRVASGLDVQALEKAGLLNEAGTVLISGYDHALNFVFIAVLQLTGLKIVGRWNPIPGDRFNVVPADAPAPKVVTAVTPNKPMTFTITVEDSSFPPGVVKQAIENALLHEVVEKGYAADILLKESAQ